MAQENVEVVRGAWQAFVNGGIEATFDLWTDDCVFEDFPEMPESAVYVGREGLIEAVKHFTEMWSGLAWEPVEFIDAGEPGHRGDRHPRPGRIQRCSSGRNRNRALRDAGRKSLPECNRE